MKTLSISLILLLVLSILSPSYIYPAESPPQQTAGEGGIPYYVWIGLGVALGSFIIHTALTTDDEDEEGEVSEDESGEVSEEESEVEEVVEFEYDKDKVIVIE